jgi:hypothetical protein
MSEKLVSGREHWEAPEPSDEMVWAVCPWTRNFKDCQRCPEWRVDEDGDRVQDGCRAIAAGACRVVFAAAKKWPPGPPRKVPNEAGGE